jgi:hypothetical protein
VEIYSYWAMINIIRFRALLDYTSILVNTKVSSLPFSLGDHPHTDISGECNSLDISRLRVEFLSRGELSR